MSADPGSLHVVHYPDAALRRPAMPLTEIDEHVRAVAARMIELMRQEQGIGLAAPQVGLPWRLFVADVPPGEDASPDDDPPSATRGVRVYVNPRLHGFEGEATIREEGCLSLPDIRGDVPRSPRVSVTALGLDGRPFTERGAGLLARCWQHEVDHLDGVLIIDRMTQMSRLKNRAAIRDLERAR